MTQIAKRTTSTTTTVEVFGDGTSAEPTSPDAPTPSTGSALGDTTPMPSPEDASSAVPPAVENLPAQTESATAPITDGGLSGAESGPTDGGDEADCYCFCPPPGWRLVRRPRGRR